MKKLKIISLMIFLTAAYSLHADSPNYSMCGGKPGIIDKLFTDAEKIRLKCIEDVYQANKEKVRKEIEELHALSTNISSELKKTAIKVDYNLVQCAPKSGAPARDPVLVQRCQELVTAQRSIISRIDELSGWNEKPRDKNATIKNTDKIDPPCPSKEKLKEMQVARMFNRKLFVTWERCVTANVEEYFQ